MYMQCPSCGGSDTRVIDSRPAEGGRAIRRRRSCELCGHRFTSYERLEPQLLVRKRSGRLEAFSATKLTAGLSAALADRPVTGSDVEAVVSDVEHALRAHGLQEISSEMIGQQVLERLRTIDEVAYLRFASVYKEFTDVSDFEKEMAELESPDQ